MKHIFCALLMALSSPSFAQYDYSTAPKAVPVRPEATTTITKEDLRKTIEHIQRLAKQQQLELEKAKSDNLAVRQELGDAKTAHLKALEQADVLQKEVDAVTADRNEQARLKDRALEQADYWKAKQQEAVKKLWWWRIWAGGAGLALLTVAGLWLYGKISLPKFK